MEAQSELLERLSLTGRKAVVTGACGGIGSAVVDVLAGAGASVLRVDRPELASGAEDFLACDLADRRDVEELLLAINSRCERLDVLVHCAGVARDAVLWKLGDGDWDEVLRVNLDAAFLLLRGLKPLLVRSDSAAVVLVSSINGERGKVGQANYAASKAGLIGLGRTAARELGPRGVRVNMIAPGLIETPMTAGLPDEVRRQALEESALGRAGEPEDVACAALYLCSALGRHVTGQVLRVDGGQLMA